MAMNQTSGVSTSERFNTEPLDNLLMPAEDIFDEASMDEFIRGLVSESRDSGEIRSAALQELKSRRQDGLARIEQVCREQFPTNPFAALKAVRTYTYLTDGIVRSVLKLATGTLHSGNGMPVRFSVAAVGGYGRAEMAAFSDVDLLFLIEDKITKWIEEVIETTLYLLWDMNLKVGHSCRNSKDCVRLGKEDFTIRTALLEHRLVHGDRDLAIELHERIWNDLFKGTGPEFVEAKLAERETRNERQSGNRYVLEPNVKEGKGGLRDLQTLFWIAKYLHRVDHPSELIGLDVFSIEEFEKFLSAEAFLWSVRCVMHMIAGKAQDKLHFDNQEEVADWLGYMDQRGRSAVEYFMQEYFLHATVVGELTRIFLTAMEAQHVKREPRVIGFLRSRGLQFGTRVGPGYKQVHGRLAIADDGEFLKDPLNVLRLFDEALVTGLLLHPDAMRLIAANLHLIDEKFRNDPEANRLFIDVLIEHGNPERVLRRMNELGFLGMFVPEFREIVAMMQPGGYHHYTVDEHTIQCISTLSQIEGGEYREELPVASEILEKGVNRRVLYIALLLHDVGKGSGRDHSTVGAEIAAQLGPRFGLNEDETDTVVWLVQNHLLMSDTCQKRDISDPKTVRDFARKVENRTRLKLLTVLTVCDIRGVGPGIWTNWKAQLLRDLYRMTHRVMSEGVVEIGLTDVDAAKDLFRSAMSGQPEKSIADEIGRHGKAYWQVLPTDAQVAFARLLDGIPDDEVRNDTMLDADRDATRICFAMADHPGLFVRIAGTLALASANVVEAKTFTSSDGYATAVFWVQDQRGRPYEKSRVKRLMTMIRKTMSGEIDTRSALRTRDRERQQKPGAKRELSFRVPTEITFDNEGSDIHTIIEVDTRDRPGLMYDLANTMYRSNVVISSAVIATYGVQAVDVFYVKDIAGLKLHSKSRCDSLKKKLQEAIEKGTELAAA